MTIPHTIFLDIDGTILKSLPLHQLSIQPGELLPGVHEKLNEWESKGYRVIITTGRKECQRKFTENQLERLGVHYDQLVMGLGGGPRVLINDMTEDNRLKAYCCNVERDKGLQGLSI